MQIRSLSTEGGIHLRRSNIAAAATGFIACIGDADFGRRGIEQINRFVPVSWWTVYRLHDRAPPQFHLGGTHEAEDVIPRAWQAYRDGVYLRDRTLEAAGDPLRAGGSVMTYLHAHEIAPEHRRRVYTAHGLSERVAMAHRMAKGDTLCVSFYRRVGQRSFTDDELDDLQHAGGLLLSCVERHLCIAGVHALVSPLDGLPRRERQVCDLLLQGLTHDGVAADLGVSVTTVRTYRDRAFSRLGICHRSQLFALMLPRHPKR